MTTPIQVTQQWIYYDENGKETRRTGWTGDQSVIADRWLTSEPFKPNERSAKFSVEHTWKWNITYALR